MSTLCHIKYDKYQDKFIETIDKYPPGFRSATGPHQFNPEVIEIDNVKCFYINGTSSFINFWPDYNIDYLDEFTITIKCKLEKIGCIFSFTDRGSSPSIEYVGTLWVNSDSIEYSIIGNGAYHKEYLDDSIDIYAWHTWKYIYDHGNVMITMDNSIISAHNFGSASKQTPITGYSVIFNWNRDWNRYNSNGYINEFRLDDIVKNPINLLYSDFTIKNV